MRTPQRRMRFYPRYEEATREHLVSIVVCGYCHEPVLPHGSLCIFDKHLAIDVHDGSFVLLSDPEQPDLGGWAVKFLRRAADGTLELASNVGRKRLTRQTIIGTLVAVYLPGKGAQDPVDSRLRALVGEAATREAARRADVAAAAVKRWGNAS
jgi:hypothetical protein